MYAGASVIEIKLLAEESKSDYRRFLCSVANLARLKAKGDELQAAFPCPAALSWSRGRVEVRIREAVCVTCELQIT